MKSIKGLFFGALLLTLLYGCGSTPEKGGSTGRAQSVPVPPEAQQAYGKVLVSMDNQEWNSAEVLLQDMIVNYPKLLGLKASLGWVYWKGGQTDKAIETLEPLLSNRKLYKPDAFNTLAIIYREQGEFNKAKSVYQKALGIWSNDPQLHKNMGILYDLYLGQSSEALNHYRQAQKLQTKKDKKLKGWIKDLERRVQ